jgi:hypothetical protein
MRRLLPLIAFLLCVVPAQAFSPLQVAIVTPAYQAPGGTGWTPASLGSALKADWNADALSDGAVTTWTDSVSSLAPTQATAGFKPVRAATSYNANTPKPGVTCDGTDDLLRTTTNVSTLPTSSTAGEIWMEVDFLSAASVSGVKYALQYGATGTASRGLRRNLVDSSLNRLSIFDGASSVADSSVDISGPHVWHGEWSGTTMRGDIDGKPAADGLTTIATLATGTTAIEVCASVSGTLFGNVVVRRIIVTTDLSTADEQRMQAYLAADGATTARLPYNHPYRFRRP